VLGYLNERFGGPPQVALALGGHLENLGAQVSFWATGDDNDRFQLKNDKIRAHLYEISRPKSWFRAPKLIEDLSQQADSIKLFHLHEFWSWPQYAVTKLATKKEIPYIIRPAGVLKKWSIRHKGMKKRIYLSLIGKRMCRNAACFHAITKNEADDLRALGHDGPVTIIPNGVNAEEYLNLPEPAEAEEHWPELSGRKMVLFLSRISPEKGLNELLPAWSNLMERKAYRDSILVLAGPDDRNYLSNVKAMVDKYNLNKQVLFTGMVRGRKKQLLISRADVYILPSYSEGFSMSLLENLAAANPVLITPGCNFPEIVREQAGFCVTPERNRLAEALRELLDMSDQKRRAMGLRGQKLVHENYTWRIAAQKLITVYRCVRQGRVIPEYPLPALSDRDK